MVVLTTLDVVVTATHLVLVVTAQLVVELVQTALNNTQEDMVVMGQVVT